MLESALIVIVSGLAAGWAAVSWVRDRYRYGNIKIGVFLAGSLFAFFSLLRLAALIWSWRDVNTFTSLILYALTLEKLVKWIDRVAKREQDRKL